MSASIQQMFNKLSGDNWGCPITFQRTNEVPLEKYSVFSTFNEASSYAKNNKIAYPSQQIAVIDDLSNISFYYIDSKGDLSALTDKQYIEDTYVSKAGSNSISATNTFSGVNTFTNTISSNSNTYLSNVTVSNNLTVDFQKVNDLGTYRLSDFVDDARTTIEDLYSGIAEVINIACKDTGITFTLDSELSVAFDTINKIGGTSGLNVSGYIPLDLTTCTVADGWVKLNYIINNANVSVSRTLHEALMRFNVRYDVIERSVAALNIRLSGVQAEISSNLSGDDNVKTWLSTKFDITGLSSKTADSNISVKGNISTTGTLNAGNTTVTSLTANTSISTASLTATNLNSTNLTASVATATTSLSTPSITATSGHVNNLTADTSISTPALTATNVNITNLTANNIDANIISTSNDMDEISVASYMHAQDGLYVSNGFGADHGTIDESLFITGDTRNLSSTTFHNGYTESQAVIVDGRGILFRPRNTNTGIGFALSGWMLSIKELDGNPMISIDKYSGVTNPATGVITWSKAN